MTASRRHRSTQARLPPAGEARALDTWHRYRSEDARATPPSATGPTSTRHSRLSPYLKVGAIHPRTILADLGEHDSTFRKELAWREFYAAVLARWPDSTRRESSTSACADMHHDHGTTADERFVAWCEGQTGYPIVDAGMRQLRAEGWMHNRVRMITASFLTKDLHLPWWRGARHFMSLLVDGDLASNQHGWQWTAGTGTDAAPYFRIFNPVTQGRRVDPDGDYVRRWVPELRAVQGAAAHEPWKLTGAAGQVSRTDRRPRRRARGGIARYRDATGRS